MENGTPVSVVMLDGRVLHAIRRQDGVLVESQTNTVIPAGEVANILESLMG